MKAFSDYDIYVEGAGEQRAHCPMCPLVKPYKNVGSRRDKDLAVNTSTGIWFCHRCGWSGSLNGTGTHNVQLYEPIEDHIETPSEKLYAFFAERGISKSTVDRNNIGIRDGDVAFRYYVAGNLVNVKYRSLTEKKFHQEGKAKGATSVFYKLNDISDQHECIITEGEMDALAFEEAGFKNAVSVPEGGVQPNAKNTEQKLEFLDNSIDFFKHIKTIYLALDADRPGRRMAEELARRLGRYRCKIVSFPDGSKDANDVLLQHGAEHLKACLHKAHDYPIKGIHYAKEKTRELEDLYENGLPVGPLTEVWPHFDNHIKHHNSNLIVITGTPQSGKSTFLDNWFLHLARKHEMRFALFTPENKIREYHQMKLIETITGKKFLPGVENRCTRAEWEEANTFLHDRYHWILPEKNDFSLDEIFEATRDVVQRHGVKGLLIDSWMKLAHLQRENETSDRYHSRVLNEITHFASEYGINVYLVAHTTKMERSKDNINFVEPTLYDISGSAHFFNIPDIGIVVYRRFNKDYTRSETKVIFKKIRDDFLGKLGNVFFSFDKEQRRFHEYQSWTSQGLGSINYFKHNFLKV